MEKTDLTLPQKHSSYSDWDIDPAIWTIDIAEYVSPPSSIRYLAPSPKTIHQLCKHTGTIKLPQGRLVTQLRFDLATQFLYIYFRNTAALGTANHQNCYRLYTKPNLATFRIDEYLTGALIRSWTTAHQTFAGEIWWRHRLNWWLTWGVLQVRLEHEVAGEWVQDGTDISIPDPLFGDEAIQRCGVGGYLTGAPRKVWFDDTEIWEYVP